MYTRRANYVKRWPRLNPESNSVQFLEYASIIRVMLHVQIHPFLVQTLPPPPLLSLSLFNPLHASFSSRLLSLAPDSLSVPRTHARTHTPPRGSIQTWLVGRLSCRYSVLRSSSIPEKALTKPRQRGGSPLLAQQQSSFGGTPAPLA